MKKAPPQMWRSFFVSCSRKMVQLMANISEFALDKSLHGTQAVTSAVKIKSG
jgi:hypothetical protein